MESGNKEYLTLKIKRGSVKINNVEYRDLSTFSIRGLDDEKYILIDNHPVEVYNVDIKIELLNCKIDTINVNDSQIKLMNSNVNNIHANFSDIRNTNSKIKKSINNSCTVTNKNININNDYKNHGGGFCLE